MDHRAAASAIPDASYTVTNIDRMAQQDRLEKDSFHLVLSFATFYHLVDPVGALPAVYRLLGEGGLAVVAHVPMEACLQGADSRSYLQWNR